MTAEYSIWLMPCAADLAVFQAVVDELAPQFGQPAFLPHVTVQGDLALPLDAVAAQVRSLAAAWPAQHWPVVDVERSDFFFRCLYLRFERTPAFDGLQGGAQLFSGTAQGLSPYPHLSLAYGQVQPYQAALVEALRARFKGRTVVFDRLAVCLSSKDIPIAQWRCVVEAPLATSAPG
ncbi:MAG: hypothetical protein JWP29_3584 [Rhodoferax sp.]|nr:hypothetical protein [Rhodoferax sp.]